MPTISTLLPLRCAQEGDVFLSFHSARRSTASMQPLAWPGCRVARNRTIFLMFLSPVVLNRYNRRFSEVGVMQTIGSPSDPPTQIVSISGQAAAFLNELDPGLHVDRLCWRYTPKNKKMTRTRRRREFGKTRALVLGRLNLGPHLPTRS